MVTGGAGGSGAGSAGTGGTGGGAGSVTCDPGTADCDSDPSDCETNVDGDVAHCGGCNQACSLNGASNQFCSGGKCGGTVSLSGSEINDTWVNDGSKGTNYGNEDALEVDGDDVKRILVKPTNLSAKVPPGSTIINAELELQCFNVGGEVTVHRVTTFWDENTVDWNDQPSHDGTSTYGFTPSSNGLYTLPITSIVQAWSGGAQPDGIMLKSDSTAAGGGSDYRSREHGSDGPVFSITFIEP